jgi:hypothetical protein
MSLNKKSLEDNISEIKANLPEEFHADLEKSIAETTDTVVPSTDEQKAAAAAELKANPDIDDSAIEVGAEAFEAPAQLSEEETKSAIEAELKNWES